ncbi:MAG TPA: HD domain-containing protein [Bryobacterales bacterium]|nr:HD domain-containing protein [Bryobacterales bacterium]
MTLTIRFDEALAYAAELHRGQRRKASGVPYISHLLAVTATVIEHGGGEDEAIAALLHDAVEDQGGPATREQIRLRFGERVAAIVDGCTDTDIVPKPPWQARKTAFIETLRMANASVHLVVAADKLHNAGSTLADYRRLGDEVWDRFNGGRDGTLWYYRSAVDTLDKAPRTLIDLLRRVISDLESEAGRGAEL